MTNEKYSICPCCYKTEENCSCAPDCPDCSCDGRQGAIHEEYTEPKED